MMVARHVVTNILKYHPPSALNLMYNLPAVKLSGAHLNLGYSYTYGPEVDGYIDGAGYSSRLHEVYAGINWEL